MTDKDTETDADTQSEHAYRIVLPLLDSMSYGDQRDVVLNWVKYVMIRWAEDVTPDTMHTALPAFTLLACRFASHIMGLPMAMGDELELKVCEGCPRCKVEGVEAPVPVGTSRESSSN